MQKNKNYTITEFARLVGVDYQIIYQAVKRGHICKSIILDKKTNKFKYRIPHDEVEKFGLPLIDNFIDKLVNVIKNGYNINNR